MEFLVNAQVKASSKGCKINFDCPSETCTGIALRHLHVEIMCEILLFEK